MICTDYQILNQIQKWWRRAFVKGFGSAEIDIVEGSDENNCILGLHYCT